MNREKLIDVYRKLVVSETDNAEWMICALIWTALRKGERGSVKWATTHLRNRAYDARQARRPATLASL